MVISKMQIVFTFFSADLEISLNVRQTSVTTSPVLWIDTQDDIA